MQAENNEVSGESSEGESEGDGEDSDGDVIPVSYMPISGDEMVALQEIMSQGQQVPVFCAS